VTWLPALRIARREALRAKGRSALIVAMVALPVVGIGATDVLLRSAQLDPDERLARELGRTQGRVDWFGGGRVFQPPDPDQDGATSVGNPTASAPRLELPPGYRVLVEREGTLSFRTRAGEAPLDVVEVAVGDQAFHGKYAIEAGQAPRSEDEVAVSSVALERLGATVGGTAELVGSGRTVRVVGVLEQIGDREREVVWALPGSLIAKDVAASSPSFYLSGAEPITWTDVLRLNRQGFLVSSRAVVLDPPPRAEVPFYTQGFDVDRGQEELAAVLGVILVVTLGVLEVVLLAGAAFAVGARRQARSLGLVTAAGGEAGDVRRVVLAGGFVLGVAGALVGVALALGLAALAMPLLERYGDTEFGRYDLRPLELAGAALLGLVAALLAAALPARTAARRDPVEALTGRRGQVRTLRKVPAIGLGLAGLGVALASIGSLVAISSAAGVSPVAGQTSLIAGGLIAAGAGLTQLGLIVCSPAIVALAARLSRRLPLPLRLALTDASRHRGRSAPAVAAVLTAVTGATAVALIAAAFDAHDRENYTPAWPAGTGGVMLEQHDSDAAGNPKVTLADPSSVLQAVRGELPPLRPLVVRSERTCVDVGCSYTNAVLPKEQECPVATDGSVPADDPRCDPAQTYHATALHPTPVGDAELLRLLVGRVPAQAAEALAGDGVVVLDPHYAPNGRFVTETTSADGERTSRRAFPAVVVPVAAPPVIAIWSDRAAKKLGLRIAPTHLLLDFDQLPTTDEEDAARQDLREAGFVADLTVERGYRSEYGLGLLALVGGAALITLGAAGIATGLAQADARSDHATLAAVGATPGLRRTLAAAQALAVAGLGTLLGVLAGLVPGLAFVGAVDSLDLAIPWLTLVEVLVGIPLVAAVCAWLLTRSRLPLERRVAL
jgi:putative ABC transport system permease protein